MSTDVVEQRKKQTRSFIFRISVCFIALYVGISLGFAALSPVKYFYTKENLGIQAATIFLQPFMEIVANGKVTQSFHWETIQKENINQEVKPVRVISKDRPVRDFTNPFSEFTSSLGLAREAALVEPESLTYQGKWSLVFCALKDGQVQTCQKSILSHKGLVKILVDGESQLWGLDENNQYIPLTLRKYIERHQRRDLVFI